MRRDMLFLLEERVESQRAVMVRRGAVRGVAAPVIDRPPRHLRAFFAQRRCGARAGPAPALLVPALPLPLDQRVRRRAFAEAVLADRPDRARGGHADDRAQLVVALVGGADGRHARPCLAVPYLG